MPRPKIEKVEYSFQLSPFGTPNAYVFRVLNSEGNTRTRMGQVTLRKDKLKWEPIPLIVVPTCHKTVLGECVQQAKDALKAHIANGCPKRTP